MRHPLLASGVQEDFGTKVGWSPVARRASLLAAGASALAFGLFSAGQAQAANVPGVLQITEENIAINLLEIGEDDPAAEFGGAVTDNNPGGAALAEAFVTCAETITCPNPGAIMQWARGTDAASNSLSVGGSLGISADALAEGATATAAGIIEFGVWQVAAAEGSAGNHLAFSGTVDIGANAEAIATGGSALAFAAIGAGISQVATSISLDGTVANTLENSGELSIVANAAAEADAADAAATALVGAGIFQQAAGQAAADADLVNSGTILIGANAAATAPAGIAAATASAAGILQLVDARTQQFGSTVTDGGNLVGTTSYNPSGPASATVSNSGSLTVQASASALGDIDASATAVAIGLLQQVSGSSAEASIDNSGSINIIASVEAEASGSPRGVVFVSGLSQAATAYAFETVETISTDGVLTYQLGSTPVGPAVASLANSGDISVVGEVSVIAHGTGTTDEGLGVAFVDGFDQNANGDGAEAIVNNSGSFTVVADVTVDSGNVSNAIAIASGIDQGATAYAAHTTLVFASGTTTPTGFTATGTAIGAASAAFNNSGSLTVIASVDSHGDEVAFAGATASAIGQFAAGTEASVSIDNSGSIAALATLQSSGPTAFGGVGAIGFQQGAQATAEAEALFDNAGTFEVVAAGHADGEIGAFVNATAFGGAQNALAEEVAIASFANSGTVEISAIAGAVAGDTATHDSALAFAIAHGIGQLAQGAQATVEFENSGSFQLLADVDVTAEDIGIGSATASGVIQQIASGTAAGSALASIDNSGTITIGAFADVAAGSTAAAIAAVNSAMVQAVVAGELATAQIVNSGSIAMIAEAEALAAGGAVTDIASAQAYIFGINALASATATAGSANVDLVNDGSIDIHALAHATGSGLAQALATAAWGLVGTANTAGNGPAGVSLTNSGELTLVGRAEATGGFTANATGIAIAGMDAFAAGAGDATAAIVNSGELALVADAHASAGTNAVAVAIAIDGLQMTAHAGVGDALAEVTNSGELSMLANATATALNAQAFAIVGGTFFTGAIFQSAAALGGDASVLAENSGSVSIVADALANGEVIASASAVGGPGVNQFAFATSGDAFASISNSGSMEFLAHAEANASNSAFADALFYNAVGQFVNANGGAGEGSLLLTNEGSISVAAVAEANGDAVAGAFAIATHEIGQVALVMGNDANAQLDNSGAIDLQVAALAKGSIADAAAVLATAVIQGASAIGEGEASVELDNSGTIDMSVLASAESPDGLATAFAQLDRAVSQYAGAGSSEYSFGTTEGGMSSASQNIFPTGPAAVSLENSGAIDIAVAALAVGGTSAVAEASGQAIEQFGRGLDVTVSLSNEGEASISLGASAEAEEAASASGSLTGISQVAAALETTIHMTATEGGGQVTDTLTNPVGSALASFENSGSLEVVGAAEAAAGEGPAHAAMFVQGIAQSVAALDGVAAFANDGEITIFARAEAAGTAASATATVVGYGVSGSEAFSLEFSNDGEIAVLAEALLDAASGMAAAHALGVDASGDGPLAGEIENDGDILVRARAVGGTSASAHATGISIGTSADGIVVNNSGVLAVEAVTDGGTGGATAIKVVDNGSGGPGGITITNDGGVIIARVSSDGGTGWSRGTAIDLSSASSSSVLNLAGDGRITGDINLAAGQVINVAGGESWFNGIINAECTASPCGEGILNIGDGGSLFLRHVSGSGDGPSLAYLEELNITTGGTLLLELPSGEDPESAYPQIVAGTANLDGALLVRSGPGLYEDEYSFDDVIDADVRNGQFDICGIDGNPALLELSCSYDGDGNVDLAIERIAFNEVSGLTRNQGSVGSGIEAVYDLDLAGPFADLVGELFTFDDAEYRQALDQLAGASHAAYLQSFNSLGDSQAMLIDRGISCELPGAVSSLSCRPGRLNLWGQIDYANRDSDGDEEAGGYDADRWTAIIGADVEVGPDMIVGASLAKVGNRLSFHDGGRWNADGYQLGAYGAIDRGSFYAKVIGTIAWFDGDSSRRIDWTPIGGTLQGQLRGDADARLWTLGAHLGYRVELGSNALLTPFLNVDHSSARLDQFTETGLAGADLVIDESSSSRTAVTVGAKWAVDLGTVIPQAELGYRHRFGDRRASIDAAFAAEAGSAFELVSAEEKRGSLLAGLSLGGKAGPVDVRVGYQGLFDGNSTSHSANFRVVLPIGGK